MIIDIHTHNAQDGVRTLRTIGIHPWHAADSDIATIETEAAEAEAIGEIGLDFACNVPRAKQEGVFRAQLALAERLHKPVVLHSVRAFEEVMRILRDYRLPSVIFHGFIGSVAQAQRAVAQGYYLSFGERTTRSPKSNEALRATPLSRLFVESDESHTPITEIYALVAKLRGTSTADLMHASRANFEALTTSGR